VTYALLIVTKKHRPWMIWNCYNVAELLDC